ncbi:metal ABC transporter substrate-binding protein [Oscillospiraceae bacterium MB08-C2-2]|nr:metal ABC transporter substrate-binding protein [Oscillospiraceae bacterium MB08-C2-2]
MKHMISWLLVMALTLGVLSGCQPAAPSTNAQNPNEDKLKVVATIFPPYDFVREIAGDKVELFQLLPPGAESHSFEPTPQDMIKIQECDVFIYVGGDSDAWVEHILESVDTSNKKIIALTETVETVEEEMVEGMEHEDEEDHDHEEESDHEHEEEHQHEKDEHVWTSPKNAMKIVQALSDALCEADSVHASAYEAGTATYLEKLTELDNAFAKIVAEGSRKTLVFGDRFPFRYFVDTYGLDYSAAFSGCSTQTDASAATVAFLIDRVKSENIPVVLHIELSNQKIADTVCEATGAKKLLFHSCHNVTKEDLEAGDGYLSLMTKNLDALKEALN